MLNFAKLSQTPILHEAFATVRESVPHCHVAKVTRNKDMTHMLRFALRQ